MSENTPEDSKRKKRAPPPPPSRRGRKKPQIMRRPHERKKSVEKETENAVSEPKNEVSEQVVRSKPTVPPVLAGRCPPQLIRVFPGPNFNREGRSSGRGHGPASPVVKRERSLDNFPAVNPDEVEQYGEYYGEGGQEGRILPTEVPGVGRERSLVELHYAEDALEIEETQMNDLGNSPRDIEYIEEEPQEIVEMEKGEEEIPEKIIGRPRYNSLLMSQNLTFRKEYLFRSKLYFRKKKRGKWKELYCVLTEKRQMDFLVKLDGEKAFSLDLDGAKYRKCPNLVIEVKVEYPNPSRRFLKSPTNVLFNEWMTYFNILGVEEEDPKQIHLLEVFQKWEKEDENLFYRKPYTLWGTATFNRFLEHIRISYAQSCSDRYSDLFEGIDGDRLEFNWFQDDVDVKEKLQGLGITDELHLEIIRREFEKLALCKYFDITPFIVQNKMEQMFLKKMGKVDKPFPAFLNYCKHFHRVDLIQKTIKHILTKYDDLKFGSKRYKVKFIMTENLQNWRSKQLRKLMGVPLSIGNKVGLLDVQFGMFHAAFAIGSLQMEWVDNSLVLIRSISSEKVLLCVDIGYYDVQNVEEFSEKMALEVIKWNRQCIYNTMNLNKKKYHANCQQFVVYFVSGVFGLELKFSNAIVQYLKTMKDFGKDQMVFTFGRDFAKAVSISETSPFLPKNHKELDRFVHKMLRTCPEFPIKFPSEWDLLRGFDRAFWMKYFHQYKMMLKREGRPDNEMDYEYECEYTQCEDGCPFNMYSGTDNFKLE